LGLGVWLTTSHCKTFTITLEMNVISGMSKVMGQSPMLAFSITSDEIFDSTTRELVSLS